MLPRFRRRAEHTAPAQEVRDPASGSDGNGPPSQRSDRPVRSFNRYELKYLIPTSSLEELSRELGEHLDEDPHGTDGGYGVWSVYYDTSDLRSYWEKIEGLRFRRKLRVRHYGTRSSLTDDSDVFVEIKQRVNKVTQKRRVVMPYRRARMLCDRRCLEPEDSERDGVDRALAEEILGLVCGLDLRPTAVTGYQRSAYLGRDADLGLRVTFDRRVLGRDRDFHLGTLGGNRYIVPAGLAVMEVKANERVPFWFTDLAARRELSVVRISKYCQSIEAHGLVPRSRFHVSEDPVAPPEQDVPADPASALPAACEPTACEPASRESTSRESTSRVGSACVVRASGVRASFPTDRSDRTMNTAVPEDGAVSVLESEH
ncbi:MAG: polyphosphate polymerase protein [Actinomycetota bacterium]|nr:polyphosphate polymerase protein [Actinomycetota bacterium]